MKLENCWKKTSRYLLAMVAFLYLGYNAIHGEQGIIGGAVERYRQERLSHELQKVKQQRSNLEHRISLLSGNQVDMDLLDEMVRRTLPLISKNQIIIAK